MPALKKCLPPPRFHPPPPPRITKKACPRNTVPWEHCATGTLCLWNTFPQLSLPREHYAPGSLHCLRGSLCPRNTMAQTTAPASLRLPLHFHCSRPHKPGTHTAQRGIAAQISESTSPHRTSVRNRLASLTVCLSSAAQYPTCALPGSSEIPGQEPETECTMACGVRRSGTFPEMKTGSSVKYFMS